MAKIEIRHDPGLTKDKLLDLFQKKFQGKYEIYPTKSMINRDFVVKKSARSGIFVKLDQKSDKTVVVFNKDCPSVFWRSFPILRMMGGKDVKADVEAFLQTMAES
ncbi:MAG: hypothetical protein NTZ26_09115 [Candidatus Aminicenantes bacterium]|nr:hypothetical protein [Candidatus Aminicenantes bacterium]